MLASSDYEGTVTLWDAFTGVKSKIFQVRKMFYSSQQGFCFSVSVERLLNHRHGKEWSSMIF